MDWTQWFVIHWTQCAASVFVVLILSRLMMRRWKSPDEKIKSICIILAALTALPICSLVSFLPGLRVELDGWEKIPKKDSGQAWVAEALQSQSKSILQNDTPDRLTAWASPRVPDTSTLAQAPTSDYASPWPLEASIGLDASEYAKAQTAAAHVSPIAVAFLLIVFLQSLGFIGVVLTWFMGRMRLHRIIGTSSNVSMELRERWNRVSNGKGTHVRLLESNLVSSPMTIGLRVPMVIVPKQLTLSSTTDVDFCLAHEWAHINRRDAWVWAWFRAVKMLYWFQPGIRSLGRELRLCQELIADRTVVRTFDMPDIYCELLIRLSVNRSRQLAGAMAMAGCPSQLSARVTALLEPDVRQSKRIGSWVQGGVCVIVVFLVLGINAIRFTSADAAEPVLLQKNPSKPRAIRYTRTVSTKDKPNADRIYQETVVDDGRYRSELEAKEPDLREISFSSESEGVDTTISYLLKHAFRPSLFGVHRHTYQQLLGLRDGRQVATEELGVKLVNERMVNGFRMAQFERTYTVWNDVSTGELVQVEYDASRSEHITMTDFQLDVPVDDSQFSEEIPVGFKVTDFTRPRGWLASWSVRTLQRTSPSRPMANLVNASKVWGRESRYSRIIQLDGDRFLQFRLGQMDVVSAKGTRLSNFPVQANELSCVDMDGDGKKELIAVKASQLKFPIKKTEPIPASVTLYSEDGRSLWTHEISNDKVKRLKYGGLPRLSKPIVADFTGDNCREICIDFTSSLPPNRLLFDKEGNEVQSPLLEQGAKSVVLLQLDGATKDQYLVVDAEGELLVCNRMGETLRRFSENTKTRTWMVRTHEGSGRKKILAIGQNRDSRSRYQYVLTAYTPSGENLWETSLKRAPLDTLLCPNRPWIAVSQFDGVEIIDVDEGKTIASVPCESSRGMAWVADPEGKPLLVVVEKDDELVITQRTAAFRINE